MFRRVVQALRLFVPRASGKVLFQKRMTAKEWIREKIAEKGVPPTHVDNILRLICGNGLSDADWTMKVESKEDEDIMQQCFHESRPLIIAYLTEEMFPSRIVMSFYS